MSILDDRVIEVVAAPYPVVEVVRPRWPDETSVVEIVIRGPQGNQGVQGEQGEIGETGETGEAGPPGAEFEQTFAVPSYRWVVVHNLNVYPVVTTIDTNGETIVGDVSTPDRNTVVIDWLVPFAGTARLKA